MRYLQSAFDLAESRGYLRYPEVLAAQDRVPDWFRTLGTPHGIAEFEALRGFEVPAAVQEFYACLPLTSFLEVASGGEVFLTNFAALSDVELPPVVHWAARPHLVFSFHNHSGMVFAAQFGAADPLTFCGFDCDPNPFVDRKLPPEAFTAWVFGAVDGYDAILDHWQRVCEECRRHPKEEARLGGIEWVRSMPGMAQRLG